MKANSKRCFLPPPTTEVEGRAYLCFPSDQSWFQGYIDTEDDFQYTISGTKVCDSNPQESVCENVYSGILTDHFQAQTYSLGQIRVLKEDCIYRISSSEVHFESERTFKGQKADMLIQNFLPMLVGQKLCVFTGKMKVVLCSSRQNEARRVSPAWIL